MADYVMKERNLPLHDSWDVIVVGGGPAGCAAAVASGREGARTLLVEATGVLGGMGTSGLVPWWCGFHDGEKIIARGMAERILNISRDHMPFLAKALEENPLCSPAIDPELLKRIYDDMVEEAGVEVLFHTQLCSVDRSNDEVTTIILSNKNGLGAFSAKVFVDGSGDGDLATWAGAECEKGDSEGHMQPTTHCFVITDVDEDLLRKGPGIHFFDPKSPIHKAIRSKKYPLIIELHSCLMKIGPGAFGFNTGHVFDVDNTDPQSTSKALVHGRRMAAQYHEAFKEYHPAFANSFLAATGSLMGVRETRRIMGDYVLSVDDYRAKRSFHDEICRNAYGIDVHFAKAYALENARLTIEKVKERIHKRTQPLGKGESVGVPYRCLTAKGLKNVLVAGRCISTDRTVNGSVRIMACCLNTGEAAGIAAATAARDSGDVHAVDTDELRRKLKAYGGYLPDVPVEPR